MTLGGRFVALLALGAVAVVALGSTAPRAYAAAAVWVLGCLAAAAIDLALAASPRDLLVTRRLPARSRLGETVESRVILHNTGRRTLRGALRDAWQPSAGVSGRGRRRFVLPAGERRAVTFTLTPARRGTLRSASVTVRSFGPLALAARQVTLAAPGELRVLPPFLSRKHLPSRLARLRELDGRTAALVRGQGTEFDSLREYVRGDDVRSIDWRATARRAAGELKVMVRTWRPERDRRIVVVVDTSRTSAARIDDEPRLDAAIESALLLAALADRAGDRVSVLAYDRAPRARVHGATGADLLARIVDGFADAEPQLVEMDWAAVPSQVRRLSSQRALVVLLTSLDSVGAARGMLAVLPQLTERHEVIVASVADPGVLALTHELETVTDVYRAAAAERTLQGTARLAAAVRRLGASVVTAPPAELPPALADSYLALKAAGRL